MQLTNRVSIKNMQQKIKLHLHKIGRKLSFFPDAYLKSVATDFTSALHDDGLNVNNRESQEGK